MSSKPLRILHCAMFSLNKYGANYYSGVNRISNGLIRNGHFVFDFSYRDVARQEAPLGIKRLGQKKMNKSLIETAEQISADILLLGHAEFIEAQTLIEIKKRLPNCKIAMWWVDWWHNLVKYDGLMQQRMPLLDGFFMTSDPDYVRENYSPMRDVDKFFFMPNSCDPSMDTGNAYALDNPRHDVLFVGRSFSARDVFISRLESTLTDVNVGIYGRTRKEFVLGNAYMDLISNSRIGINYQRDNSMPLSTSNRMIHLAANGCLVFTTEIPKMTELFSSKEVVYFDDLADCSEKIRYYLAHPEEAKTIAKAGQARAHKDYNAKNVTADMVHRISD